MTTVRLQVFRDEDAERSEPIAEFEVVVTDPANTTFIAVLPDEVKVHSPNKPKVIET